MSKDLASYSIDELTLIYKNQGFRKLENDEYASSYEVENGHYGVYNQQGGYEEEGYYGDYTQDAQYCFITTAVCSTFGKPDDCEELMAFRRFRDEFMTKNEEMMREIEKYYDIAPKICKAIENNGKEYAKNTYAWIWDTFLSKAYDALTNKELELAHQIYKDMVLELEKIYL